MFFDATETNPIGAAAGRWLILQFAIKSADRGVSLEESTWLR